MTILVFDSGIGGLTVLREARVLMYALFFIEIGSLLAVYAVFGPRGLLVLLGLVYLVAFVLCSRDTRLAGLLPPKPGNRSPIA